MCGFAGFLSPESLIDNSTDILLSMGDSISHRGPDSSGVWLSDDETIGMSHRRLAIVDLSVAGHQPMVSKSGELVLSFNGEIYNHQEIRGLIDTEKHIEWRGYSDTETLIEAFELWGLESTLKKIKGMFSFALWDSLKEELILGRDRLGEKPLYYGYCNGSMIFGSELKALMRFPGFNKTINKAVLPIYLEKLCIPAPYSIFENIYKLEAGTFLTVKKKDLRQKFNRYWDYSSISQDEVMISDEAYISRLEQLLSESISYQMRTDVPFGAFLSGGIDSSCVVALMQSLSKQKIKTFTIGFGSDKYNEAEVSRIVAQHLGTDHEELYVSGKDALSVVPLLPTIYDEPFSDPSQIPTYLVSKLAKTKVTVALSGDGGDELFYGYSRYQRASQQWNFVKKIPKLFRVLLTRIVEATPDNIWSKMNHLNQEKMYGDKVLRITRLLNAQNFVHFYQLHTSNWSCNSFEVLNNVNRDLHQSDSQLSGEDEISRFSFMSGKDINSFLPDDILVKVDRATMAVSLESRIPMLDVDVVTFANSLPHDLKHRKGVSKWCLRQILFKFVPKEIIDLPKKGFDIPLSSWLRNELKSWTLSVLNPTKLSSQGLLCPLTVDKMLQQHFDMDRDWSKELWSLMMLQCWIDENI